MPIEIDNSILPPIVKVNKLISKMNFNFGIAVEGNTRHW